ncbi:thiamine biosynthesis protein ThiS [Marinobacterium aestuarii]|uniref:Thiamine biosynthesis protein ThiS n=1 Tax=Marinobacterium aestuarii TaxID=1821621 RepID=A0A1A9F3N0_9GAMM|nr:sulfur carrier protein ThiS [Marinobacterium aestuarii]ANG64488.1 thiamine biosynthesis protein ThiS [Marinobacterium aestuarii]
MIQCHINGQATRIPEGHSLTDLIEQLGLSGRRLAIELNAEIVPRTAHATVTLNNNDRVEIVHAIGGG